MAYNRYARTRYFQRRRDAEATSRLAEIEHGATTCQTCGRETRTDEYERYGCWRCRLVAAGMIKTA